MPAVEVSHAFQIWRSFWWPFTLEKEDCFPDQHFRPLIGLIFLLSILEGVKTTWVAAHPRFDCDLSPKMAFSWTLGRQISPGPLPGCNTLVVDPHTPASRAGGAAGRAGLKHAPFGKGERQAPHPEATREYYLGIKEISNAQPQDSIESNH